MEILKMNTEAPKTCFSSDYHFGHLNIIKYSKRPCQASHGELNDWIVKQHNSVVNPQDEFYHLGDLTFYRKDQYDLIAKNVQRLNGTKHMIVGNHDDESILRRLHHDGLIASYQHYKEIYKDNNKIVLFHYPIYQWNKGHKGSWCLHGHCHGTFNNYTAGGKIIDVGLDAHPKKIPYTYMELLGVMALKKPGTHHDL